MPREPLLSEHDFAALLLSGANAFLARRQGSPPVLDRASISAGLTWRDMPFQGLFREYEKTALDFFGIEAEPILDPQESLAASGRRLAGLWRDGPRNIVFFTSGSTGAAKPCPHSEDFLRQEATAVSALFPDTRRVVSTMQPFHSYGFIFGFLLPKLLRLPRLELSALPSFLAPRLLPGDLVVSFPLFFKKLLSPPPPGVGCLTSTAPCPPVVFAELRRLGFTDLTEIYGSSETGAMGSRDAGDAPFTLLPHWSRADDENLLRADPAGGEATRYFLPDHVTWFDGRRLSPQGRRDHAVQVAGVNVYPEKVAAAIRTYPQVADCAVRLMRPEEGERLKAFVVLREGADPVAARAGLRELLRETLPPAERPGRIRFGAALPRTDLGKAMDWDSEP